MQNTFNQTCVTVVVVVVVFIVELPLKASEEALVCRINLTWYFESLSGSIC